MKLSTSKNKVMRLLALLAVLMLIVGMGGRAVRAQEAGTVAVTKTISGDLTTVPTGVEFTYLLNYSYASTTESGQNVTLVDMLDSALSWAGSEVTIGTTPHIDSANFNAATGEVEWRFVDPLPAGSSGVLELKVRFPNGTTPPNTIAANTATIDADNATPTTSVPVYITAEASCKWIIDLTGPSNPPLDQNVTYTARLNRPSPNTGTLNATTGSTMAVTLPLGVLSTDIVNLGGGTITSGDGVTTPIVVTWDASTANSSADFTRSVVVRYDSSRFALTNNLTVQMTSDLTVVGGGACGGTDTVSSTISPPAPNGTTGKSSFIDGYGSAINQIRLNRPFYFTLDANNTGNTDLESFVINDTLPPNFALSEIRLPSVNNDPGGNYIHVRYRLNTDAAGAAYSDWPSSPFPAGTTTLPTSELNLSAGQYVRDVQFDFGAVPVGFNINTNIRLYGSLITPGWDTPPTEIGGQVCNTMALEYAFDGTPTTKNSTRCIDVVGDRVRPAVAKSIVSGGSGIPGLKTIWQVALSNHIWSDIDMKNPVGMELLPADLEYIPGSFRQEGSNTANAPDPTPTLEVIPNYNGTGRTLLRWSYPNHSFPVNTQSAVRFETILKPGAAPGQIANYAYVSVAQEEQDGLATYISPVTDENDLNGNTYTTEFIGRSGAANLNVNSAASLDSYKLVKGELDADYSKYPDIGQTSPGGTVDYKLVVINTGNISLKDVVILDILAHVGDSAVTSTTQRNSEWQPRLAGPVSTPAGVIVEYSTVSNPCRPEMGHAGACAAPNWSSTPPDDITTVMSLRFNFGDLVLNPLDEFELNWSMRAPVGAPENGEVAWNSFGVIATRVDNNATLLPTEPIQVGIQLQPARPAAYGDRVWLDMNGNGIQDDNELGFNGVRVELYRDNGDGVSDPDTDEYVGFTTTTVDGTYLFSNLPEGDYYAVFFPPPTYVSSSPNAGGDDAVDSDGVPGTVRGLPALIAPVTTLNAGDDDRTWDQGLYQPEELVAAVGNYVWNDKNGDGIQNESASDGLNGILVTLYDGLGNEVATTVTANDTNGNPGYYLFDGLTPGDYSIGFTLPDGFTFTTQNSPGSDTSTGSDPNPADGQTAQFTLTGGQYDPTWDAGVRVPSGTLSLGDLVWLDYDGDGRYDPDEGEIGVNGVRVNLYRDENGDGIFTPGVDSFLTSTTTYGSAGIPGYYEFTDLPEGDYIVQIDPVNFMAGGPLQNTPSSPVSTEDPNDDVDNDNNGLPFPGYGVVSSAIELRAEEEPSNEGFHNPTVDFGFLPAGTIGDTIYYDYDGNGDMDGFDSGIPGITVMLEADYDGDGTVDETFTDVTDGEGKYLFENLRPGTYTVTVMDPPSGYTNTADPDGGYDDTSNLPLRLSERNLNQDFGYQPPSFCPVDQAGNTYTDILGAGMGNPKKHKNVVKVNIPNSGNVVELYGQLAAKDEGLPKYVRFIFPGKKNWLQVNEITSPSARSSSVFWYGADLDPNAKNVRGRWFLQKTGTKKHIPRAFILYPTYQDTSREWVNVFELMHAQDTQVYWDEPNNWVQTQTVEVDIPAPLGPVTLNVKVAMVDNDKDNRPVYLTVSAGGVTSQVRPVAPNKGDQLNIIEFELVGVQPGTNVIEFTLYSPGPGTDGLDYLGGDSAVITGVVANYECAIPTQ